MAELARQTKESESHTPVQHEQDIKEKKEKELESSVIAEPAKEIEATPPIVDAPSSPTTLEQKFANLAKCTQKCADEFKSMKIGRGIPLEFAWAGPSTITQTNLALAFQIKQLADQAVQDKNQGEKMAAVLNLSRTIEIYKTCFMIIDLINRMPEPLQRLIDVIPKEDCECTCRTNGQRCEAHIYQVPSGVDPRMKLGMVKPHVLVRMIVIRIQNFLWSLNRPDSEVELDRDVYNIMNSSDHNANWHGAPLSDFPPGESTKFASYFDAFVKIHHFLAGDDSSPSAAEVIQDAYKTGMDAKYAFEQKIKYERAKEASVRPPKKFTGVSLDF
jgi:hypothetical protein